MAPDWVGINLDRSFSFHPTFVSRMGYSPIRVERRWRGEKLSVGSVRSAAFTFPALVSDKPEIIDKAALFSLGIEYPDMVDAASAPASRFFRSFFARSRV